MQVFRFLGRTTVAGLLVIAPIYLTSLLLAHGFHTAAGLIRPVKHLLPHWLPSEEALAVLALLTVCFLLGLAIRTGSGRWMQQWLENKLLSRVPGYTQIRDLSRQIAGDQQQKAWKPALVQFNDGLVHAFLVEECNEDLVAVFIPAIPSVLNGEVFIMDRKRVHLLDVSFATAFKSLSHWGAGSKELVAACSGLSQKQSSVTRGTP